MTGSDRVSSDGITNREEKRVSDRWFDRAIWALLILGSIVLLYPIFHMIMRSFSGTIDMIGRRGFLLFPSSPTLENYKQIFFDRPNLRQAALVSAARTIIGALTSTTANAMLAYILSRKRFMFRSALYRFWVFTLAAPVALLPQFAIFRSMHLVQTFWVYIIPSLVSVFHVMVMKTYMEAIPDSLEESAQLDGAGYVKIFCSIVSPLCKPVYATIAFFIAVNQWNSWFDAMLYNRMLTKYSTLQFELMKYLTQNAVASSSSISTAESSAASSQIIGTYSYENRPTPKTLAAAISVVTIIPVIALYPFFQRYFVSSLTIRGIKD